MYLVAGAAFFSFFFVFSYVRVFVIPFFVRNSCAGVISFLRARRQGKDGERCARIGDVVSAIQKAYHLSTRSARIYGPKSREGDTGPSEGGVPLKKRTAKGGTVNVSE